MSFLDRERTIESLAAQIAGYMEIADEMGVAPEEPGYPAQMAAKAIGDSEVARAAIQRAFEIRRASTEGDARY